MRARKARPAAAPRPAAGDIQQAAWRDRRFVIFAAGNLANNIGDAIYAIAMPLLIYQLTRSLIAMSFLAVLMPAMLLAGPLIGAIADRRGPRVLVLGGLAIQLAAAAALNVVIGTGHSALAVIIALSALVQIGGAAYRQGWMAGVPAMFPDNPVRARGTLSSLYVSSTILGPMILGATVGWLGYLGLLWVNLATFCAPIVVWAAGIHPPGTCPAGRGTGSSIWRDIAQGWGVIRRSPSVLRFTLTVLPLEFTASAGLITLAIYYLRDHWHLTAGHVGLIFTAVSVGALAGSLAVSERLRFRLRPVLAIAAAGMTTCLIAMALQTLAAFVIALALFFAFDGALGVTSDMLLVKYLPHAAIGRAAGISRLIHGAPLVAGPLTIPLIVDLAGVRLTFISLAALALPSVVLVLRYWSGWDIAAAAGQSVLSAGLGTAEPGGSAPDAPVPGVCHPTVASDKESLCAS